MKCPGCGVDMFIRKGGDIGKMTTWACPKVSCPIDEVRGVLVK